ncbi:hypothetical protein CspeluHIS016_0403310 [Cutaneotrichosporon spelunceum]|uniref:Uncharacterized protein n=1 Tax=Cutaneotrichosporon spelunceum TaxID=1672016 RepID=A0AAD3TV48_9TREE|nr:hypothetical protein CspeluHIS016_0403310 [Cutaneotrichosporon spelunceum]
MQRDAPTSTRALLSNLEHLRDSLSDRVEQLSNAVERLRNQATELEVAVTGSPVRPSATPLRDPVIEVMALTSAMTGLAFDPSRGLEPTNLARVAAAPKPIVVRGPERNESDSEEQPQEAHAASTDQPRSTPIPDVWGEEPTPTPPEPERWDWWVHPPTPRPPGLTTRGILVRAREGPSTETERHAERDRERELERDHDRDRDAREAERLDRAIARYQRRHDESQREFQNAWESERTRAVGGGRVPNEHSSARADALRRHVDNAHRLWQLMHQRARLAVPPTEPDAPLEMRHLLGTPSFRRGPMRPRHRPPRPMPTWPNREEREELFNEYYRDFTYGAESDEDDLATQRVSVMERLQLTRPVDGSLVGEARVRDLHERLAERVRVASEQRRELETRADDMATATRQLRSRANELVEATRQLGRQSDDTDRGRLRPRPRGLMPWADRIPRWVHQSPPRSPLVPRTVDRAEDTRSEPGTEGESAGAAIERAAIAHEFARLSAAANLGRPSGEGVRERQGDIEFGNTDDDGDASRRALLASMSSTLVRLNAAARRPLGLQSEDDDVLERVQLARDRVQELARIQRDLEAVRTGMRRGSDATVVPLDWPPLVEGGVEREQAGGGDERERSERAERSGANESSEGSEESGDGGSGISDLESRQRLEMSNYLRDMVASFEREPESQADVPLAVFERPETVQVGAPAMPEAGPAPPAASDEDKESGTLRADTWPGGPSRARPRPYISLLDL